MKKIIRNIVLNLLIKLARIRLRRLRLFIIGVTGSVGKTSSKEAIYSVLKSKYQVDRSEKSYNTDFGLPLAVLGQQSGFSSPIKWTKTMIGAVWNAFVGGRQVQMLVIEMGVDKPGDMDKLLKIVQPQIGVITNIKPVHMDEGQFRDLDDIFMEKKKLVESLPEKGVAVLNADDPYLISLRDKLKCRTFFYGYSDLADLQVTDLKHSFGGLEFVLKYKDEVSAVQVSLLGVFQVYTVLSAVAVALVQGFSLEEAAAVIHEFKLPPGRMNPIPGIRDSLIIDSSYNASPEAVKEAINVLSESPGRKIAVLGSMNELGVMGETKHREIGRYAAAHVDMLLTVGEAARFISNEALNEGFSAELVAHFDDAEAAAKYLHNVIQSGDTILVKGSQNKIRLEKLVEKIMRDPGMAGEMLVRQGSGWKNIS